MKSKITKFEDLEIWQEAHKLALDVYRLTLKMPREEMYGISSQLKRASTSVPANIVEGYYRRTTKEMVNFLFMARGSAGETIYFLLLSMEQEYISKSEYVGLRKRYEVLIMRINALIKSLKSKLK